MRRTGGAVAAHANFAKQPHAKGEERRRPAAEMVRETRTLPTRLGEMSPLPSS
jgi:hypothetical protein